MVTAARTLAVTMSTTGDDQPQAALGTGAWVVLPTYNEIDNQSGFSLILLPAVGPGFQSDQVESAFENP